MEYVVMGETPEGEITIIERGFPSEEEARTTQSECRIGSGYGSN
jgi:hypothetical protein